MMNEKRDENFRFIRKGVVGSYKDDMSPEYIKKFDDWIKVQLQDSDFKFQE